MSVMRPHRGQFVVVPTFVVDHDTLSDGALRLYAVMADYTDPDGRCWPARSTLAERCRCSTDTIDRRVRELEDMGLLRRERRNGPEGQASNLWTLVIHRRQVRGQVSRTSAAHPSRASAAQNQTHIEPEAVSADMRPLPDAHDLRAAFDQRLENDGGEGDGQSGIAQARAALHPPPKGDPT